MMSEEFHEIVLNMRVVESVEDFEVLAADRELRPGTLVVLPAGLALRLLWNNGGVELCAAWFEAMAELHEIDEAFKQIIKDQEGTDEAAPQQDQR